MDNRTSIDMRSRSLRLGTPLCTVIEWNSSTSPTAKPPDTQLPSSGSRISIPPAPAPIWKS